MLMFENKGEVVGVSNPHPHCQIYATNFVFKTIENEAAITQRYWDEHRRVLMEDIIAAEESDGRRILSQNDSAVAFIPYFARYAYETFVVPRQPHASLADLSPAELRDLAAVLQRGPDSVRQPLDDAVPLRDGPAPGADRRPAPRGLPLPHRVPPAACASRTC